jgi:hypothetical protein
MKASTRSFGIVLGVMSQIDTTSQGYESIGLQWLEERGITPYIRVKDGPNLAPDLYGIEKFLDIRGPRTGRLGLAQSGAGRFGNGSSRCCCVVLDTWR